MGDRATFEIDGCDVILYSHWGGDISWVIDRLKKAVEEERAKGRAYSQLGGPAADHLILVAAREGIFDRAWARQATPPTVGDNGHFILFAPEGVPTSEWHVKRIPENVRSCQESFNRIDDGSRP